MHIYNRLIKCYFVKAQIFLQVTCSFAMLYSSSIGIVTLPIERTDISSDCCFLYENYLALKECSFLPPSVPLSTLAIGADKPTVTKLCLCSPQPSKKNMFLFVAAGEETPRKTILFLILPTLTPFESQATSSFWPVCNYPHPTKLWTVYNTPTVVKISCPSHLRVSN